MSVLRVKNGDQWDIVPAIKGDTGDPAEPGSITDEMLAPDGIKTEVEWLWGNQLKNSLSGELMQASDAYGAPMLSLGVDGKSTQDGTPTPDAPVPIESVDALALSFAGKNLLPSLYDTELTTYGITWKFDEQGRFWNKTGSEATSTRTVTLRSLDGVSLPAGDYVFSYRQEGTASLGQTKGPGITLTDENDVHRTIRDGTRPKIPFTLAEGERILALNFAISNGSTYAGFMFEPMIYAAGEDAGYEPYVGTTVPLYDGTLRSLPDGTKDTLALSYLRPSTREGWAWYSRELVQPISTVDMGTLDWSVQSAANGIYYALLPEESGEGACLCSCYQWQTSVGSNNLLDGHACRQRSYNRVLVKDTAHASMTKADYTALVSGQTFDYLLATPVTTTLDPIELPVLPAPNCTVWSDPATGLRMEYVRDTSIVIASLEAAYADLATS